MKVKGFGASIKMHRKRRMTFAFIAIIVISFIAILAVFMWNQSVKNSDGVLEYQKEIQEESALNTESLILEVEEVTQEATTEKEEDKSVLTLEEQKTQIQETLTATYHEILLKQKDEAFAMVNNLVEQCKADYENLKQSGNWNATAKAGLLSEYLAKSSIMEEQMDANFNALIVKMQEQLEAEGIDSASIIEQYRAEYETIKKENKSNLIDKAFAAIGN